MIDKYYFEFSKLYGRIMPTDEQSIKIYHIVHIDKLKSILDSGFLFCDADIMQRPQNGSMIGIQNIKDRRLSNKLSSVNNLTVGQCVPFYFCPRSVMLYVIKCQNSPDLSYLGGQNNILHLVFDLQNVLEWAKNESLQTCFTTSNAGTNYFDDYSNFSEINSILDWASINANQWSGNNIDKIVKEHKQAEFLIEKKLSVKLLETIGVYNLQNYDNVAKILSDYDIRPQVLQKKEWYY